MTGDRPLIAVLDDEESVRQAIERLLRAWGLVVEMYSTGADFLASLADHVPDCLVLDLHMPGMSGFDVQATLTRSGCRVPVVVITGHDSPESRKRALDAGAAAYFRKPVAAQALLDAVLAACHQSPPADPATKG